MDEMKHFDFNDIAANNPIDKALDKLAVAYEKLQQHERMRQEIERKWISDYHPPRFNLEEFQKSIAEIKNDSQIPDGYFEKTLDYQQKSLEILQSINDNTANLYTLVELINQNNEKQDEIIALLAETLGLAKAKSKEEADTLLKRIMHKIHSTVNDVDMMLKVMGWVTSVYKMVLPMLEKVD